MYHVSAQGIDERMINVHYYYYACVCVCEREREECNLHIVMLEPLLISILC